MNKQSDREMQNQAFIDGQTSISEHRPVRIHGKSTYIDSENIYGVNTMSAKHIIFLGCVDTDHQDLYDLIQDAGFIIVFREHNGNALSNKKGNVDTDIVFTMMRNFHENPEIDKFFLVSGDGDYYKTIRYLHSQDKLGKVLFPAHHKASSLYHQLGRSCFTYLDTADIRKKIEYKK